MVHYGTALHESKHVAMALLGGFHVQSIDVEQGYCLIEQPYPPTELGLEYRRDPAGAAFDVVSWLSVCMANSPDVSTQDWLIAVRWERAWPIGAQPAWAILENKGKIRAARARLDPGMHALVLALTGRLMARPILTGPALEGVLRGAVQDALARVQSTVQVMSSSQRSLSCGPSTRPKHTRI